MCAREQDDFLSRARLVVGLMYAATAVVSPTGRQGIKKKGVEGSKEELHGSAAVAAAATHVKYIDPNVNSRNIFPRHSSIL